jgi:hypothetical protein
MSLIEVPLLSHSSATVRLGSFRLPSLATVRDSTLGVVWEGLLPATLSLRRGLYEANVRNEAEIASHDLKVRPPEALHALEVGLRLSTIVPVSAQWRRRQSEAEAVTGLSAQLRDSGGTGGLAVTIVGARDTAARTQCEVRYEAKTLFRVTETSPSSERAHSGTAMAVHPGGYTLRIGGVGKASSASQDLDVPIYVSAGYQTLVFVPSGGTRLDRMSIHMLPIRHTWTGFEVGSLLLEGLLTARRHGVAALTFHRDLDIHGLVGLYPLLGLMLAAHLQEHYLDGEFVADLIGQLTQILPGHPDVQALAGASRLAFPPTIASVQESSLRGVVTGTTHIRSGSVAEKAMEGRVWFGAWTTWAGWWLPEASPTIEHHGYERIRAAILGAGWLSGPLRRAILRSIDLPATVRLGRQVRRLDATAVHASLADATVGKDLPTLRVLDHVRSLLETGNIDEARHTLQGRRTEETAAAVLLSATSVRNALDKVRPELRRTIEAQTVRPVAPPTVRPELKRTLEAQTVRPVVPPTVRPSIGIRVAFTGVALAILAGIVGIISVIFANVPGTSGAFIFFGIVGNLIPMVVAVAVLLLPKQRLVTIGLLQGLLWLSAAYVVFGIAYTFATHLAGYTGRAHAGFVLAAIGNVLGTIAAVVLMISWSSVADRRRVPMPGAVPVLLLCSVGLSLIADATFNAAVFLPHAPYYALDAAEIIVGLAVTWYAVTLRARPLGGALVLGWVIGAALTLMLNTTAGATVGGIGRVAVVLEFVLLAAAAILAIIYMRQPTHRQSPRSPAATNPRSTA